MSANERMHAREAAAFERGRKAGLEEAAKVADKVFYEETSGDYWAGQIAERIRRLTQGTDKGLERK
jgi:hypothetical protein